MSYNKEEKEAIEQLKSWREYIVNHRDSVNKANDREFYLRTALNLIEKQQKEIEELEKYDYRKIKIDPKNKISSIHFTKEQLDLMNLGIALYVGIPKLLTDTENEETEI